MKCERERERDEVIHGKTGLKVGKFVFCVLPLQVDALARQISPIALEWQSIHIKYHRWITRPLSSFRSFFPHFQYYKIAAYFWAKVFRGIHTHKYTPCALSPWSSLVQDGCWPFDHPKICNMNFIIRIKIINIIRYNNNIYVRTLATILLERTVRSTSMWHSVA